MIRGKVLILIVMTAAVLSGCGGIRSSGIQGTGNIKSETRRVSGFKAIKSEGVVNLEITDDKDFGLTIEGDDNLLEHVKTDVSGGTLMIAAEENISSKSGIKIKITLPDLTSFEISGVATATLPGIKADSLKLNADGASKIVIDGNVRSLEASANGASTIDAEKVKTENAKVVASGASNVTVSPRGDLDADASGASTIVYTNEPKNLKQKYSGASTIKKK